MTVGVPRLPIGEAPLRAYAGSYERPQRDFSRHSRSEFYERLQNLGRAPGIGNYQEELLSRKYRFWNFHAYVVVYVWEARPIQVIAVVHGARDLAVFLTLRLPN